MSVPTFGLMLDFCQAEPWRVPAPRYYAECLALAEEAERLSYDAVWITEHHGRTDGFISSPLVAAAAIAARTDRIRIGTNVLLLPLHHPLRVAEDGAVVHALSAGRLVLGVGQGYQPHEFALFGVNPRQRPSRLEEGIAVIRAAWAEGRTGFTGTRFAVPEGAFSPTPPGAAPIYVGGTTPVAVERAVRLGDGLLVYVAEPAEARDRYATFTAALERAGRPLIPFVLSSVLHVADAPGRAWQQAGPALAYLEGRLRGEPLTADDLEPEAYLIGTPEVVADRLAALHAAVPFDHFAFWGRLPGLRHEHASASLRLFADRVAPRLADPAADP